MQTIKKYIFLIYSLIVGLSLHAQESGINWENIDASSNRLQGKLMGEVYYITNEANSHFLMPKTWVEGEITLVNDDVFTNIELSYNRKEDKLVAYNDNTRNLFIVEKQLIKAFLFTDNGNVRRFVKLATNTKLHPFRFFEELYMGQNQLLAYRYIAEIKVSSYVDKLGILRNVEYVDRTDYYLRSNNGLEKIALKRKTFYNIFPENKKAIRAALRKNNLQIDGEKAMIKAFGLLESNNLLD